MMSPKQFLTIFAILFYSSAFTQVKDSVFFVIKKTQGEPVAYDVAVKNLRSVPICLLHGVVVNLNLDDTISLAAVKFQNGKAFFSLNKTSVESNIIYESNGADASSDVYVILPNQALKFCITAPTYNDEEIIEISFIALNDFCYKSFREAIFRNSIDWYKKYKIEKADLVIPQQRPK